MNLKTALLAGLLLFPASPLFAQEREWSLNTTDTQSYLVFGVPETDDVGVSFWCDIGKSDVSAFLPVQGNFKRGQKVPMKISAGGETTQISAKADKDDATGVLTVEGKFPAKSALMAHLKKAETVSVAVADHNATYPLDDADFDGFLTACKGVSN